MKAINPLSKLLALGLIFTLYSGCSDQSGIKDPLGRTLKSHTINYVDAPIVIDGKLTEAAWESAATVGPFVFPWEVGNNEGTRAKLLWDDQYLYVSFVCDDAHISAEHTERDSPVYRDDCVEVFTSPNPDQLEKYFNLEMNARAAHLDFFHPEGPGSKADWDPEILIATSFNGTLNDDTDRDQSWTLEVAIPFTAFAEVAKHTPPQNGDEWRLNLNRLGDKTNHELSQWSPGDPDNQGFHAPQFFGRVFFKK